MKKKIKLVLILSFFLIAVLAVFGVSNHIAEIKKAVDDAYSNPYKISSQK